MKAIVVHEYGGPEVLKWKEYPEPLSEAAKAQATVEKGGVGKKLLVA